MPRTPSAFPFSGRLRHRAINPTPPKRVKAWGDGPLRPEVMYPVVEHTRTDCAARNHSRSRAPHHRTQSSIAKKTSPVSWLSRAAYSFFGVPYFCVPTLLICLLIISAVVILDIPLPFIRTIYLPTPPLGQDMTQGQFLSRV